jgi:[histone H3]-lysine9 N-trimethyltransferase SUV39H
MPWRVTLTSFWPKTSLPYIPARPPSTAPAKSRLSTPSDDSIFIKKLRRGSLFKSPDWQNKKIFQRDAEEFSTPTPTAQSNDRQNDKSSETIYDDFVESRASQSQPNTVKQESYHERLRKNNARTNTPRSEIKTYRKKLKKDQKALSSFKAENDTTYAHEFGQNSSVKDQSAAKLRFREKHLAPSTLIRPNDSRSTTTTRVSPPQAINSTPKKKPSRPTIVVEIGRPRDQTPELTRSASRSLLDKFRQPLTRTEAKRSASIALKEAKQDREAFLLAELMQDTSIARSRASTVEEIFGSHGLSEYYDDTAIDEAQRKALAQPKAKEAKRSKIKLDWGTPEKEHCVHNPTDIIPPAEQARRLLDAKFEDIPGRAPLTFVNKINDRRIDGKFQFIDSYILKGFKPQSAPGDFGCLCSKQCDPLQAACRCLQRSERNNVVPYIRQYDGLVVLNPSFIDSIHGGTRQEIYECNDSCNCSKECLNRVVQKGRTIPLQIFMTRRCGFGIRSPQPIKKGQFIDVYLGELLTTEAIIEYEMAATEKSSSYVFSLDFFVEASYHIQGLHFGSPTRFINHSCNPNTRIFTVMMNHADQKIFKIAYFAIRDIPAKKEITFDYSPESAHEERWVPKPGAEDENVVRCLCGEENCRGRVWPKQQMAKRKGRGWART